MVTPCIVTHMNNATDTPSDLTLPEQGLCEELIDAGVHPNIAWLVVLSKRVSQTAHVSHSKKALVQGRREALDEAVRDADEADRVARAAAEEFAEYAKKVTV